MQTQSVSSSDQVLAAVPYPPPTHYSTLALSLALRLCRCLCRSLSLSVSWCDVFGQRWKVCYVARTWHIIEWQRGRGICPHAQKGRPVRPGLRGTAQPAQRIWICNEIMLTNTHTHTLTHSHAGTGKLWHVMPNEMKCVAVCEWQRRRAKMSGMKGGGGGNA